jgi:hypothetical protein
VGPLLRFCQTGNRPFPAVVHGRAGLRNQRRDPLAEYVAWERTQITPIRPLLGALAFTSGDRNWGYKLRFGLFEIGEGDMDLIEEAMIQRHQAVSLNERLWAI